MAKARDIKKRIAGVGKTRKITRTMEMVATSKMQKWQRVVTSSRPYSNNLVEVLRHIFRKSLEEATMIMLNVHKNGIGCCGLFTYEIAETKIDMVHSCARERGFPLQCTMEKE